MNPSRMMNDGSRSSHGSTRLVNTALSFMPKSVPRHGRRRAVIGPPPPRASVLASRGQRDRSTSEVGVVLREAGVGLFLGLRHRLLDAGATVVDALQRFADDGAGLEERSEQRAGGG